MTIRTMCIVETLGVKTILWRQGPIRARLGLFELAALTRTGEELVDDRPTVDSAMVQLQLLTSINYDVRCTLFVVRTCILYVVNTWTM